MKNFLFLFLIAANLLMAQDQTTQVAPSVIPPSPDAAALGKYGEVPVGYYSGIPVIDIPLYEAKSNKLSMPISISYHAGGNKVEDIASNVGLGWTLNAGGAITRTVQGLPDDQANGFLNSSNTLPADMTNISSATMKLIAQNSMDGLPDVFYFNFGSYSGKFIFDKSGNCYSIPNKKFKIKPGIGPLNGGTSYWEVTADNGIKYTFAETETSTVQSVCGNTGSIPAQSYNTQTYVSTWYLTKVEAPQASEIITLSYLPQSFQFDAKGTSSYYKVSGDAPSYTSNCDTRINLSSKIIDKIVFRGGSVKFSTASRDDLVGAGRITEFAVKNYREEFIKKVSFDNSTYFDSGCNGALCKRLKLNSVKEIGRNNVENQPYIFEYNTEVLPARNSFDTDHWGYYNKKSNSTAVPEFIDYFNESLEYDYLPGAIKTPNENAAKAGVLTKLIYPTGGYSQFEYELNDVISSALPNSGTGIKSKYRIDGTPSNPNKESAVFTIQGYSVNGLYVTVRYQTAGCSTSSIPSIEGNCPSLQIIGVNGTSYSSVFQSGLVKEIRIFLPNGQYKLKGANVYSGQSYFLEAEYETEVNSTKKLAGGLRIKRISESDGFNGNLKVRKFSYNDQSGNTTGRLNGYPKYHYTSVTWYGAPYCVKSTNFIRTQESNMSLGTTRGAFVGYGKVTELKGENGEFGKTEYYYTSVWKSEVDNNTTFVDANVTVLPFGPPQQDNEYLRGFLLRQVDLKFQSGLYYPVKELINNYKVIGSSVLIRGIKTSIYEENTCVPSNPIDFRTAIMLRNGNLAYVYDYSIERNYNTDGITFVESRTDYTFNPSHLQLTESITTLDSDPSNLWKKRVKTIYAGDYPTVGAANDDMTKAIKAMQQVLHNYSMPIEKQIWEQRGSIEKLVGAEINLFKQNGCEVDKQLKLQTTNPLIAYSAQQTDPSATYSPSSINTSTGLFTFDNTFLPGIPKFRTSISFDQYDTPTGNILQMTGANGLSQSFLWGYSNNYPIAEATNATNSSIFYTSFEEYSTGNWYINPSATLISNDGIAGSNCYNGYLETSVSANVGKYIVSFWAKGNGNVSVNGNNVAVTSPSSWSLYTYNLTLGTAQKITVNTNGLLIDELRAHPVDANMKTYTYAPLVGMTSASSDANIPVKYQYDDLNRLQNSIDHTAATTRKISYKVKGYTGPPAGSSLNANFSYGGSTTPGSTLTFYASAAAGVQYDWDFGDGTSAINGGTTITHVFAAGIYQVQLTARKGDLSNSSQSSITIQIPPPPPPTWAAPGITINNINRVLKFSLNPPYQYYEVTISATAIPGAGGVSPFKKYIWQYGDNGMLETTVPDATMTFNPLLDPPPSGPCSPPQTYSYNISCKVRDANDVDSQIGQVTAAYTAPVGSFSATPSSFAGDYNATTSNFTINNATGNISVTPSDSWIHVTGISQCSSFTISIDSNLGPNNTNTSARSGYLTVSTGTQTLTIGIGQGGYTSNGCQPGCFKNANNQCVCP